MDPEALPQPVLYSASSAYWNGHLGVEVHGWREDGHVVHHAPNGGAWEGPPTAQSRTRLFHIESDFFEHTNLALDEKYAKRASEIVQRMEERLNTSSAQVPKADEQ